MRLKEFQDLLDRYGGDLFEWPPAQRADALALLKTSVEANGLLEETRRMENLLAEDVAVPEPRPDAIDRVMARIQDHEGRIRSETASSTGGGEPKRSVLKEILNELGGYIYRPALLFIGFSLIGILVGVADKIYVDQDLQSSLLFLVMNL